MPDDELNSGVRNRASNTDQSQQTASGELPVQVIEASSGWIPVNWAELWRYRELLGFLTWRDIKIRYKQTALGAAWAILQPVANMIVFTVILGRLAGLDQKTGPMPYAVTLYAGMLPWTFFSNSITNSGSSLVGSSNLITKVYFPRLSIPIAAVGAGLVDFAVSALVLVALMIGYRIGLTPQILLLPVALIGTIALATGMGTLLSALTVEYRDFRYVVPFAVQMWQFASPVLYPASLVPAEWRWAYFLNPVAGLLEGYRACFLGEPFQWWPLLYSLVASAFCFLLGAAYFRKVERRFADVI